MKKLLFVIPVVAILAACSSTDVYQKRADSERERQTDLVKRSIDKAPEWMLKVPKSEGAVYANGTAVSPDMEMAVTKAKMLAYGKICMSAGGEVDQQSRVFRTDAGNTSSENSEVAIRAVCRKVDITGVEPSQKVLIAEGNRYRAYVLVALPIGDANQLRKTKVNEEAGRNAATRSTEAFKELDQKTEPKTEFKPGAQVTPVDVQNSEYVARRSEALTKPGVVVLQTLVN